MKAGDGGTDAEEGKIEDEVQDHDSQGQANMGEGNVRSVEAGDFVGDEANYAAGDGSGQGKNEVLSDPGANDTADHITVAASIVLSDVLGDGAAGTGLDEDEVAGEVVDEPPDSAQGQVHFADHVGGQEEEDGEVGDDGQRAGGHVEDDLSVLLLYQGRCRLWKGIEHYGRAGRAVRCRATKVEFKASACNARGARLNVKW